MDFNLSEEQEMLRKMARDFFVNELPKSLVREMATDAKGYTPELWRQMAELGWTGLIIPEDYDGLGMSFLDLVILLEEMGRACLSAPYFSTVVLGALTILKAGNEKHKKELLPGIANGELLVTLAITEQDARFTPDAVKVKAVQDNEGYIIDGIKLFIPDAHAADKIICVARTKEDSNPEQGLTLFLVDSNADGLTCNQLVTMVGDKQCELVFNNVKIKQENILGELNNGWSYISEIVKHAAVAKCAEMVGLFQQAFEMAVDYAKERVQFGRPIGSFQIIQHYCADLATYVDGSRYITYEAAWRISEGLPYTKEASVAKAWLSLISTKIMILAHEIHGTIGFTEDHDLPLYSKRAKQGELFFGDEYFHEEIVAQEMGL
jgi:alkylation response protein AidB-like acyl-CoA dehydrogenase